MKELEKPGRDPRDKIETFEFDPNVKTPDDLIAGMELPGIVTNITNQHVRVRVVEVDHRRHRIALSMKGVRQ